MKMLNILENVRDCTAKPMKDALEEIRVAKAQLGKDRVDLNKEKAELAAKASMYSASDSHTTHNHLSQTQTGTHARQYNYYFAGSVPKDSAFFNSSAFNNNGSFLVGDDSVSKVNEYTHGNVSFPNVNGLFLSPPANSNGEGARAFTSLEFRTRPNQGLLPEPAGRAAIDRAQPSPSETFVSIALSPAHLY